MRKKPRLPEKLYPPDLEFDESLDDDEVFRRAMSEVNPIPGAKRRRILDKRGLAAGALARQKREEEEDGRQLLLRALRDDSHFELFHLNEYVEGGTRAWDTRLIGKLRTGGFSVQAELDLHGLNQGEAIRELESFMQDCCRKGVSCVRVVHGKGNNSEHQVAVLKSHVQRWLSRRRSSRFVVAYTSARPVDGGGGALYVLLRPSSAAKPTR